MLSTFLSMGGSTVISCWAVLGVHGCGGGHADSRLSPTRCFVSCLGDVVALRLDDFLEVQSESHGARHSYSAPVVGVKHRRGPFDERRDSRGTELPLGNSNADPTPPPTAGSDSSKRRRRAMSLSRRTTFARLWAPTAAPRLNRRLDSPLWIARVNRCSRRVYFDFDRLGACARPTTRDPRLEGSMLHCERGRAHSRRGQTRTSANRTSSNPFVFGIRRAGRTSRSI